MLRLGCGLIVLVATLALSGVASAETVSMKRRVQWDEGDKFVFGVLDVVAREGEANTVELEYLASPGGGAPAWVVTETTAPITAGERCEEVTAQTVRCQASDIRRIATVHVELGDMDDEAAYVNEKWHDVYLELTGGEGDDELTGSWSRLEGGPGNDKLVGGSGQENLEGDDGDDLLEGHGEGDHLDGGLGDDVVRGGGSYDTLRAGGGAYEPGQAGTDTLDGGPGDDDLDDEDWIGTTPEINADTLIGGEGSDSVVSYAGASGQVVVDLTKTTGQGRPGENDIFEGIENTYGGSRDDVLIGNDADNSFTGGAGRDLMVGNGGNDHLFSSADRNRRAHLYGPDRVYGDAGDDVIETLPTVESELACGDGEDVVRLEDYADDKPHSSLGPLVSHTCERMLMRGLPGYGYYRTSVAIDPLPMKVRRTRLDFSFFHAKCCMHFMEIEHVTGERRELAHKRVRRNTISLNVGRKVIERSRERTVTLRGKVTKVARNRFVWRFQFGPDAF